MTKSVSKPKTIKRDSGLVFADTDDAIMECWPVIVQLRPHLVRENFLDLVRLQMKEGFQLVFLRHRGKAAAVAGIRLINNLAWGRFIYVDDLVTDEKLRSTGLGKRLIRGLMTEARAYGCNRFELDSGVQRFGAHRFYLREGMFISCHHFSHELK
jgi:GNAT superfamily N-acetyltransferase